MIRTSLLTLLLIFSQNARAHNGSELHKKMEALGDNFKIVGLAIRAGEVSATELDATEQMQRLIASAALLLPEAANTKDLEIEYRTYMAELIEASLRLEDEVKLVLTGPQTQDLTQVTAVFTEMNEIRKKGHNVFKTDD